MKNKKALIRGFVFALVAAVVLLTAYNLPQNAKKAETPVSETNAKAVQNETDVLELAENAQPSSEKAVSGNCETAEENEDVTDLPQENVQAEAETPPAAEPAFPENAETAVMPTPSETEPAPQETLQLRFPFRSEAAQAFDDLGRKTPERHVVHRAERLFQGLHVGKAAGLQEKLSFLLR